MTSIFDGLFSALSSVTDAIVGAIWAFLSFIGMTIESLIMALIGPAIDAVVSPLSDALKKSWATVKPWFLALNYFLPLKECLAIVAILWVLWGLIVAIRWTLKFIPTLSS